MGESMARVDPEERGCWVIRGRIFCFFIRSHIHFGILHIFLREIVLSGMEARRDACLHVLALLPSVLRASAPPLQLLQPRSLW